MRYVCTCLPCRAKERFASNSKRWQALAAHVKTCLEQICAESKQQTQTCSGGNGGGSGGGGESGGAPALLLLHSARAQLRALSLLLHVEELQMLEDLNRYDCHSVELRYDTRWVGGWVGGWVLVGRWRCYM